MLILLQVILSSRVQWDDRELSQVPAYGLLWFGSWSKKLYRFRTIYLFSHHQLLGTVVMRDYDFLAPKYSLTRIPAHSF